MIERKLQLAVIIGAAALLSGCGTFFDDLNAAAEWQAQWDAEHPTQQAVATDYVQACQTYGCPSNAPSTPPTRPAGSCPTPLPDGTYSTGGTACPQ